MKRRVVKRELLETFRMETVMNRNAWVNALSKTTNEFLLKCQKDEIEPVEVIVTMTTVIEIAKAIKKEAKRDCKEAESL
jgi:hypothetical protein